MTDARTHEEFLKNSTATAPIIESQLIRKIVVEVNLSEETKEFLYDLLRGDTE